MVLPIYLGVDVVLRFEEYLPAMPCIINVNV